MKPESQDHYNYDSQGRLLTLKTAPRSRGTGGIAVASSDHTVDDESRLTSITSWMYDGWEDTSGETEKAGESKPNESGEPRQTE